MKNFMKYIPFLFLVGCAGFGKDCSSCNAESFGADWIIVQQNILNGDPIKCWKLNGVSVSNEERSDGIWWKDEHGNLVHISGNYNRIQVNNGRWDEAAKALNIDLSKCKNGKYSNE